MATRILIIHRQLSFAVQLKHALERSGQFDVHPFTSVQAGLDYARTHQQDLALVDFGFLGSEIVQQLRSTQPGLAIIASPKQSDTVVRTLNLQGTVNTPINVRELLPLINRALDDMIPQSDIISPPDTPHGTHMLGSFDDQPQEIPRGTVLFGQQDNPPPEQELPPPSAQFATRQFAEDPGDEMPEYNFDRLVGSTPSDAQFGTNLLAQPDDLPLEQQLGTNMLSAPDEPLFEQQYGTQLFPEDEPRVSPLAGLDTATLFGDISPPGNDDDAYPIFRPLRPLNTRLFETELPDVLPEFSSLDEVVENTENLFEPPVKEGDTPSVPETNSDALRQFLATSADTGNTFNDVLHAVGESSLESASPTEGEQPPEDPFSDLVNSLRTHPPQQNSLPVRQQQAFEFIFQSMDFDRMAEEQRGEPGNTIDEVLQEIKRPKTGTLAPEDTTSFDKLLAEEPPMPTIEESGTIGDLLSGVNDTGFRSVLAMLRGEDPSDIVESERSRPVSGPSEPKQYRTEPLNSETGRQKLDVEAEDPRQIASILPSASFAFDDGPEEDEEGGKTAAQVILETALDPNTASRPFSIESLLADIERQLPRHRPNVQPLPSWTTGSKKEPNRRKLPREQRSDTDRYVKEPDFLPEELPPQPPVLPENDFGDLTTRPSRGQGTAPDPRFTETAPQQPIRRSSRKPPEDEPPKPPLPEFDWDFGRPGDTMPELPDLPDFDTPQPAAAEIEPVQPAAQWTPPAEAYEQNQEPELSTGFEPSVPPQPTSTPAELLAWAEQFDFGQSNDDLESFEHEFGSDETEVQPLPSAYSQPPQASTPLPDQSVTTEPEQNWFNFEAAEDFDEDFYAGETDVQPLPSAYSQPPQASTSLPDQPVTAEPEQNWFNFEAAEDFDEDFYAGETDVQPLPSAYSQPTIAEPEQNWYNQFEAAEDVDEDFQDISETDIQPHPSPGEYTGGLLGKSALPEASETQFSQQNQPPNLDQFEFERFEFEQFDLEVFDEYDEDASTVLLNPAEIRQLQEAFAPAPAGQPAPVIPPSAEESRIAQLALSLTQASLELTTEATLLTHNGEIVARSGNLTDDDFDELNRMIGGTWDAASGKSHIRFITLPGSGQDYMLYSCKTDDDRTLSLIFAGKTPLRVIRSQGKKLVRAITAVPEPMPDDLPEATMLQEEPAKVESQSELIITPDEPVEVGPLTPYAFFWLLRDSNTRIEDTVAQNLYAVMDEQLTSRYWRIDRLEVRNDSIYLVAGVPGERLARDLIQELKALSARIAGADPSVWAESYLIVTPGRELDEDEIREFIEFERSA